MGLQWSRVSAGRPNKSAPDSWQDCRCCPVLLLRWQIDYGSGMRNAIIPQTLYHTSSCTVMLFKKYMFFHDVLYILSTAYIRQLNPYSKWFFKPWIVSVWSSTVPLSILHQRNAFLHWWSQIHAWPFPAWHSSLAWVNDRFAASSLLSKKRGRSNVKAPTNSAAGSWFPCPDRCPYKCPDK